MIFWNVFKNSVRLPSKKAMFALNRVGLHIAIIYLFILLALVSLPSVVGYVTNPDAFADINIIFAIVYFFIFYYLPMNILVFLGLSIIAYIGSWTAKWMDRKLHYSLLWKMSAFTVTLPLLLYSGAAFIFPVADGYIALSFLYSFTLLIIMISHYPKRRIKGKTSKSKAD